MNVAMTSLFAAMVCSQGPAARHETANFVIDAPTPQVAQVIAESADAHRVKLAKLWFDKKLPDWSMPCRIRVTITMDGPQAVTDISYAKGIVVAHQIEISGSLDEILNGPLPHELMHVLLAHHFGTQAPRWADEGAAILAEDKENGSRQRKAFDGILADRKQFPLRPFLAMRDYPKDMRCLYAQGHSIVQFLVAAKGRQKFLEFVSHGLRRDWDAAAREQYGYDDVEHLEKAWLDSLKVERDAKAGLLRLHRHALGRERDVDDVSGLHRERARLADFAAVLHPGRLNDVAVAIAGGDRRRHEAAVNAGLRGRLALEADPGVGGRRDVDQHLIGLGARIEGPAVLDAGSRSSVRRIINRGAGRVVTGPILVLVDVGSLPA